MDKNDPRVIAKLLRALAGGTDNIANGNAVIFNAAACLLEQPQPHPYISAAEVFEVYANDQIGSKRFQTTQRAKQDCDTRAAVWTDAANELRKAAAS